ncbi:Heterokaryon incompatibility protein (HET) domain containing protein [Elaphomyces granulatus]
MATQLYFPLKEDDFEIRILDVFPAEGLDEPITCSFRIASLATNPVPRYTALSYTWGDANFASDIFVNGIKRGVSPNLACALRHLRHQKETISLWADAVCINQTDELEKTAQLFIMDDIYRDAEEVLIWLGEASEDSDLAMQMIQRWSALKDQPLQNMEISTGVQIGSDQDEALSMAALDAVKNLLTRPYWTRVWIQQEVALARTVHVQCGQLCVPFDRFVQANTSWKMLRLQVVGTSDFHNWKNLPISGAASLEHLIRLRQQQQTIISSSDRAHARSDVRIFDFLRSYQHLMSTDPRDRIYALLGLYSPLSEYRSRISPSYTKPAHEVFCNVARVMIEDDNSLRPVALARNLASRSPVTPLPSWVPDWTGAEFLFPMHLHEDGNHGTEVRLDIPGNVNFSTNGLILSARGTVCDVVSVLQSTWALQYQREPDQFCNAIRNIFLPNGFSIMRAVFHLLVLNPEPSLDGLSEEQAEVYMIQAMHFLRLLIHNTYSASEHKLKITELSLIMFGKKDPACLEMIDRFFPYSPDDSAAAVFHARDTQQRLEGISQLFSIRSLAIVRNRIFFETQNGTLGIGPADVRVGDVVFYPPGYCGYFVLRPVEKHYVLVGEGGIFAPLAKLEDSGDLSVRGGHGLCTIDIW